MTMPRPGGKPKKIAEMVIPSMRQPKEQRRTSKRAEIVSPYEEKVMAVNMNGGRLPPGYR